MSAMGNPVFRKESLDKVSSPEQLNDYIKVSNVSVWIIVFAAIALVVAAAVWGIVGNLQTVISANGIGNSQENVITCYLSDVSAIEIGDSVEIGDISGTVTNIASVPVSDASISVAYDEYTVYSLGLSEWNYAVSISADGVDDGVVPLEIITDSVSPISFIWD